MGLGFHFRKLILQPRYVLPCPKVIEHVQDRALVHHFWVELQYIVEALADRIRLYG
jgi:hypothetical protein